MMMVKRLLVAGVLMATTGGAFADKPPRMREKVQEKIRALRITRLIEALDLDEKAATKVVPIVNKAYDQIGPIMKDAGEARRELRGMIEDKKVVEARANELIQRLIDDKAKIDRIEEDLTKELRKVLTTEQSARLVVFLPEINRQIQKQIREAAGWKHPEGGGFDGNRRRANERRPDGDGPPGGRVGPDREQPGMEEP
jgi:Spy/CpxP family protein refolding chaperone